MARDVSLKTAVGNALLHLYHKEVLVCSFRAPDFGAYRLMRASFSTAALQAATNTQETCVS